MYYLSGPKAPYARHVLSTQSIRRSAVRGMGDARYDPRLFPSDPYYPAVYGDYVKSQVSIPEGWWYPHPFTHYFHFDTSGIEGLSDWWNPFSWGWLKSAMSSGETSSSPVPGGVGPSIPSGTRVGQGWLAQLFGSIGSLFKSLVGQSGSESAAVPSSTAGEQLAAQKSAQWQASVLGQIGFPETLFGMDTNLVMILAAVAAAGIFFAMRQSGGRQPIVVIPSMQQKTKRNPRRRGRRRKR